MLEGDGASFVQSVNCGKRLIPGIAGQPLVQFLDRAGARPSEFLADGRFESMGLPPIVLPRNAV